jgi:hypothetical protein
MQPAELIRVGLRLSLWDTGSWQGFAESHVCHDTRPVLKVSGVYGAPRALTTMSACLLLVAVPLEGMSEQGTRELLEDLADARGARGARGPGESVPWEQVRAEVGL